MSSTLASVATGRVIAPQKAATLAETGLTPDSLSALVLKWLYRGEARGIDIADAVRLPYGILEPLLGNLRAEQLVEVKSATGTGTAGYRYALTDRGRDRARRWLDACGYTGPAPVPIDQYTSYMAALAAERPHIAPERVADGFSHLVVEPAMLNQLGPAISAGRAVFLYGAPGNGKSVMGEGIGRVLGGDIYIPYAIDVDGQIISVYDPVTHQDRGRDEDHALIRTEDAVDGRWIRIRRPVITVGGELTLDMLDLRFNPLSAFYEAPLQVKANGGVLVVDDFGRQRVPARDLLNRWVVPLEAKVDYLNLHTGRKFQVPFELMIVFATNLEPQSLADEAFLRRIPYKIFAKNPSYDQYCRIFEMNCRRHGLPYDQSLVEHLHDRYYVPRTLQRRACHPRDLIDQVVTLCQYAQRKVELTPELLDLVCQSYFLDDGQTGPTSAR
ncbi:MAG: ATP-binding protein [Vicinamibacterales bacterium]